MADEAQRHLPVMAGEVVALLAAAPGRLLVDLTVGAGGHASAFLASSAPTGRVIAVDRDAEALALARERLGHHMARVRWLHADAVTALGQLAAEGCRADAVLADLGASSMQLDEPERGFSLRVDAPLDMRMDPREQRTAADLLARLSRDELERILREYGDEPRAARIADAIVERRQRRPLVATGDLRRLVEDALGRRGGRIHPATRTFQALRIATNRELEQLEALLPAAHALLVPGGVLVVIAFHSGEDRIVKRFMRERGEAGDELLTRKPLRPGRAEVRSNPRSRSARVRALRKSPGAGAA